MSKFQVPSLNDVGCGDDTYIQTEPHSHSIKTEEYLILLLTFYRIGLEVKRFPIIIMIIITTQDLVSR